MDRLLALCCVLAMSIAAPMAVAVTVTQTVSGTGLTLLGEFKSSGAAVPPAEHQFAGKFADARTVFISFTYDTNQADANPSSTVGSYKAGTLAIAIPELGLAASRSSNSMLINVIPGSTDVLVAYANGIDSFSNSVGLPQPVVVDSSLYGAGVLVGDRLPPIPLAWGSGQFFLGFAATDGSVHNVVFNFSATSAPSGCAVTATPPTLPNGGGFVSLSTNCSGGDAPTSYNWESTPAISGLAASTATGVQDVTVAQTTTFTVTPVNGAGLGNAAQTTVRAEVLGTVTVVEYHHAGFDHYFITPVAGEIALLDAHSPPFEAWSLTGLSFKAYADASARAGAVAVCRFFNDRFAPKSSHFYAPKGSGCEDTLRLFPDWELEDDKLFNVLLPNAAGECPAGTMPVHRLYNQGMGNAPNHRFVTSLAERQKMLDRGFAAEGVAMCAPF